MFKKLLHFLGITGKSKPQVPVQIREQKQPVAESGEEKRPAAAERRKKAVGKKKIGNFQEYTNSYQEYSLEKTTRPHVLKAPEYKILARDGSMETFYISGDAFIIHTGHRMIRVEQGCFVKYIQQEYNPVTAMTENV